jgi:chromate reductase
MPDPPVRFAAYAGSLRKGSYNWMLLRALMKAAPPNVVFDVLDIADIPLYNMDLESQVPEPVTRLRETIRKADGLIIATPEHNGTIPAVTKTVIEWASRPPDASAIEKKPMAIVGASTGYYGTIRAQSALREIAVVEEVYFMIQPQIRVGRAQTKFDENGELHDADLAAELAEFMQAFVRWALRINANPPA